MNLAIFFEGTGQGVAGRMTNVTRLHDVCRKDERQRIHLESGPGTHTGSYVGGNLAGMDWRSIFRSARRWFEANYRSLPPDAIETRVYLFGFSRGATLARHFAAWLDRLGISVTYLGIWDTVDATLGLDVSVECSPNVQMARHAVARDEHRRFFDFEPLKANPRSPRQKVEEMVFPGCHSDVGGIYEDNHVLADVTLAWIAQPARRLGLRFRKGVRLVQSVDPSSIVLHDSSRLVSNLWGVLGKIRRRVADLKQHRTARLVPSREEGDAL